MIFITGVTGFIGSHLANDLHKKGERLIGLDPSPRPPEFLNKDIQFIQGSTLDCDLLESLFQKNSIDHVFHLGMTSTPQQAQSKKDLAYESIITGTKNLLQIALKHNIKSFYFFSSSHVYGDVLMESIPENAPCNPKSYYGKLKLEAENLCLEFSQNSAMRVHIIRPTSVYGTNDPTERVVVKFIKKALKGEPIEINDQSSRMDFTYIDDFIAGINQLFNTPLLSNEVFNISRGRGRTLLELSEILKSHINDLSIVLNNERAGTKKGCLNINKAKDLFNYQPSIDLEKGVEILLEANK